MSGSWCDQGVKNGVDSGFGVSFVHYRPPNPPESPNPPSKAKGCRISKRMLVLVRVLEVMRPPGRRLRRQACAGSRRARAPGEGQPQSLSIKPIDKVGN